MAGDLDQSERSNAQPLFSTAFAPRLLGLNYPSSGGSGNAGRLDAQFLHLDRSAGGFRERTAGIWLADGRIRRIDPPVVTAREFQEREGHPHELLVLRRCHRRRGDFLGGRLSSTGDAVFAYTTGGLISRINGDPNEDALGFDRMGDLEIYAVADAHHGARSSELAVRKLLELFRLAFENESGPSEEGIQTFLQRSIVRCHKTIRGDLNVGRSETALLAALRAGSRVCWASVGDGLVLQSGGNGVVRVNRDLGYGISGKKSSIWLGDSAFRSRYVDLQCGVLEAGGLLLATDGVLKHPRHRARVLAAQLGESPDPDGVARRLAQEYATEGPDNAALVYLRADRAEADRGAS